MSGDVGTYTFLPWMRQGIGNRIIDGDMDPTVTTRASINVGLVAKGREGDGGDIDIPVTREVFLYGPGDVTGVESSAIIKTEPVNWITNFEPNYLPYIEFYDEDFPWRYTPAAPSGNRLRPWVTLIVLKEDEFKDGGSIQGKPLPFIEIDAPIDSVFPASEELWAWAHVHINKNIAGSDIGPQPDDPNLVLERFTDTLNSNPDRAYSRVTCPRKLEPNTAYHAFLVPTFETGRLTGLGMNPEDAPHATFSAWGNPRTAPNSFPIYHRWYFRTGSKGDFEYLVRLLEPGKADERVGRRDIDVQDPGSNIAGILNPDLEGVLKFEGALLAPLTDEGDLALEKWENWDQPYPHVFQSDLAEFVNLSDDYDTSEAAIAHQNTNLDPAIQNDPDPLITPPVYGRWHALTNRILKDGDDNNVPNNENWVHELNLDPRWRSTAGFGTDVVVDNQEAYMEAAWDQVGDIIEANRRIRLANMARQASLHWYTSYLLPIHAQTHERLIMMTSPIRSRVIDQGLTVHHRVAQSPVSAAIVSAPLRRIMRPNSRLAEYSGFTDEVNADNLITRVNDGEVTAAPPNTVPDSLPTVEDMADELQGDTFLGPILQPLRAIPFLKYILWFLALLILLLLYLLGASGLVLTIGLAFMAGLVFLGYFFGKSLKKLDAADSLNGANQTPESVDELPQDPGFEVTTEVDVSGNSPAPQTPSTTASGPDSASAVRFKRALKDVYATVQEGAVAGQIATYTPLDTLSVAQATLTQINPSLTIPRFVLGQVQIPAHIVGLIGETFKEAMAYPEIDIPMYRPLVDKSTELFVPNLKYIKQNSITLLNTNQRFIESYMVGLNHEFARELLWREYPTDQRGSYFRQFWDVSSFLSETADDDARREELLDIPPLHRWSKFSKLGQHDNRETGRENEEELVLVIRGELLKKYPNAVIYAQKAKWTPKSDTDPTPDKTKERVIDTSSPIKTPLYEAQVKPDIYFLGFDLTEDVARGDDTVDDNPGWFFVIKERPGEPRFGLDIERDGDLQVWNDLSWPDVVPGLADGDFILLADAPNLSVANAAPAGDDQEKAPQWEEDHLLNWTDNISSAELAYILFQAPVLIGIHAAELLPES